MMSKHIKNIDDLFRIRFEQFQQDPPDYLWENINQSLNGQPPKGKGKQAKKGGNSGFTSFIAIALLIPAYLLFSSFPIPDKNTASSTEVNLANGNTGSLLAGASDQDYSGGDELIYSETRGIGTFNQWSGKKESSKETKASSLREMEASYSPVSNIIAQTSLLADETYSVLPSSALPSLLPRQPDNLTGFGSFSNNQYQISSLNSSAPLISGSKKSGNYQKPGKLMLGLFFTPEVIYHQGDQQLKNYGKTVDFQIISEKNNVVLQTGFGISRISDAGEQQVKFNKYLGSYDHVNQVLFDSVDNELVITYITETVHVYDSLNYLKISSSDRQFTYLQFPVLIGYYKEYKRFKGFVKAGPSLSVKLHEKIPGVPFSGDMDKILNVENSLPGKINMHWQFIFSGGASYQLGNRISLSVEPLFRYYIKSDYERNTMSTRHPYSIGLKTGLLLDL